MVSMEARALWLQGPGGRLAVALARSMERAGVLYLLVDVGLV